MYSGMLPCEAQIPDTLFICSFITAEEPLTYYRVLMLFATPRLVFFSPLQLGKNKTDSPPDPQLDVQREPQFSLYNGTDGTNMQQELPADSLATK